MSKPLPILVFNTTIITGLPEGGDVMSYDVARVTLNEARTLIEGEIESAVGHEGTALVLTALLGREIPVNRQAAFQANGQVALCLKIKGRLPEGKILTATEIEQIGYDLFTITRKQ